MRSAQQLSLVAAWALLVLALAGAAAAGDFYVSGQTGHSFGAGTATGENTLAMFENSGGDSDSSPVVGGAIGFEFLLGDAMSRSVNLPESVPWKLKLPNFGVRLEVEGMATRDYELTTDGFTQSFSYRTELNSFSVMVNQWLDLPIYPAVNALFGRVPVLSPMNLYFGGGLGYSRAEVETSDSLVSGKDTSNNFAWQVGGGIAYDLTDRFTIGAGYRYLDSGSTEFGLVDSAGTDSGDYQLDMHAHEVVASLRANFFSVPWPRRSTPRHDW